MFFYHGEGDRIIRVESPQSMCRTLHAAGVEAERYTVSGAGHLTAARDRRSIRKAIDFLDRTLKNKNGHTIGANRRQNKRLKRDDLLPVYPAPV